MKKIININFQGRVIPIEESAYDMLTQYVESLRKYFAHEEGRDEIINDIEGRIGELFNERIKRGAACITDVDVNAIVASIGRPEDFDAQEGADTNTASQQQQYQQTYTQTTPLSRGGLFRNSDDKVLGGVCSGLASYFKIDPIIMRIIFVVFLFGGFGFLLYIILWIVVPTKSLKSNIVKRLFRNPDDKIIGGVCGGLAQYFKLDSWIPRLIFLLPLVFGTVGGWGWRHFDVLPRIIGGSLGSTLFLTYIILWIAVPFASTASEKLEMKGERVDLNSIRDTVKDDLGSFKSKAQSFGEEMKEAAEGFGEKAKEFGNAASERASSFAAEAGPVARQAGNGIGHVLGVLFKIFFFFIAGVVALSLFGALMGITFGGMAVYPLKDFLLDSGGQTMLLWLTLLLFIAVPVIGLIIWLIRRIMNVRNNRHYLGWIFGGLWTLGWFCAIMFAASLSSSFKALSGVEEPMTITQPSNGKLMVDVKKNYTRYYDRDWFGMEWDQNLPIFGENNDSMMLNTVRVNVAKSADSSFHVFKVKYSKGNTIDGAKSLAEKLDFEIVQNDNTLNLPSGFAISKREKFRNQQVLVVIEVPVGKRIELSKKVREYDWFSVNARRRNGYNIEWDNSWDGNGGWEPNIEYMMTPDGLKKTKDLDENELKSGKFKMKIDKDGVDIETDPNDEPKDDKNKGGDYRYDDKKQKGKSDTTVVKVITKNEDNNTDDEETTSQTIKAKAASMVKTINSSSNLASPLLALHELF